MQNQRLLGCTLTLCYSLGCKSIAFQTDTFTETLLTPDKEKFHKDELNHRFLTQTGTSWLPKYLPCECGERLVFEVRMLVIKKGHNKTVSFNTIHQICSVSFLFFSPTWISFPVPLLRERILSRAYGSVGSILNKYTRC